MVPPPPEPVAVIGPGLIGGSLLLALRRTLPVASLRAWTRREEGAEQLRSLIPGIAAGTDLQAAVADASLIVLCTPVETMRELAQRLAGFSLRPGCVVTDAGSVKGPVVSALEPIFSRAGAAFIGSHPMAGSERSGLAASRADLFEGAACILTPTLFTSNAALEAARALWQLAGCRLLEMPPEEHDRRVARISHLPHLAAALVTLAALRSDKDAAACAGSGFRDVTRVAQGDPALWTGIISQNRAEIIAALEDAQLATGDLLAILRREDDNALLRLLREAKTLRETAG